MRVVVLYSGGLDSTVLLWLLIGLKHTVTALGVNYGQRHEKELAVASEICSREKIHFVRTIADSRLFGGHLTKREAYPILTGSETVVPARNVALLSMGVSFALTNEMDAVAVAAHVSDANLYPDCREEFLASYETLIQKTYRPDFRVLRPFVTQGFSKRQVVSLGRSLGAPLENTWSCYKGEAEPCGACGACIERINALA